MYECENCGEPCREEPQEGKCDACWERERTEEAKADYYRDMAREDSRRDV